MTLFFCIAFPALGVCVVTCVFPELVSKPFAGTGKRRKQSPAELLADNQRLKRELAEAKQSRACVNCGHLAGWPTSTELADSDRSDPAPHISAKAPVDAGCRDTPAAAAATVRDASLAEIALPGEEEMAAFLESERAKNAAAREADTVTLPAVVPVKPLQQAQADLEALIHATPPPAGASATEVSAITGQLASHKVHLATATSD